MIKIDMNKFRLNPIMVWVVFVFFSAALLVFRLYNHYGNELEKGVVTAHDLAHSQSLLVAGKLKGIEELIDTAARLYIDGKDDNESKKNISTLMKYQKLADPYIMDFLVLNESGEIVIWNRDQTPPFVKDREYYKHHINHNNSTILVTSPQLSKVEKGKWFFSLSKALRDNQGKLLAIGVAIIDIEKMQKEFEGYDILKNIDTDISRNSILLHQDCSVITRLPIHEKIGVGQESTLCYSVDFPIQNEIAIKEIKSQFDGRRSSAYLKPIDRYNLVVVGMVDLDDVLSEWRDGAYFLVSLWMLLILVTYFMSRAWKRAEDYRDMVVEVIESSPDYVAITDKKGKLIYLNKKGREIWDDSFFDEWSKKIFSKEKIVVAQKGKIWRGECEVYDKKQHSISTSQVVLPHFDKNGEIHSISTALRDITDIKKAKKELDRLYAELSNEKKMQESMLVQQSKLAGLGEMISAIAHQWKQPLNAISIMTQVIQDTADSEPIDNICEKINSQIAYMNQTVMDFRNYLIPSREKSDFDPFTAIEEATRLMHYQLYKSGVELQIEHLKPSKISGFPNELKQVVLNLLKNSNDVFIEKNIKNGKLTMKIDNDGNNCRILFCDNGGGIPEDLLPDKLFESFVSTKGDKGTGIGLHISKKIITEHFGGDVCAFNSEIGACFKLTIPLTK